MRILCSSTRPFENVSILMEAGGAQDARDLRGAGQLRVERHAQPEVVLNEVQPLVYSGLRTPGDRVAHAEALGNEAREQVLFVRGHHGDDEIG